MKPQIIFDNRWSGRHGIGRFCQEVLYGLDGVDTIDIGPLPSSAFDCLWLSKRLRKSSASLFLNPGYNFPLFSKMPFVITIHDLNHIDIPDNSSFTKRLYYNLLLKNACKRSKLIFTVSEFSRERILDWANVTSEKVVNIGNGVSPNFNDSSEIYSTDRPYLVYVGNSKPHKNISNMVKAFMASKAFVECELLLVGLEREYLFELLDSDVPENIKCFSGIDDDLLAKIYRGAKALILVSKYEGFGLPIVEAMSCGTPVVVSDISVFHEVAAECACFVSPDDTDSIRFGIDRVVYDQEYSRELIKNGLSNAARYSWENVRTKVTEAIDKIGLKQISG